MSNLANRWRAKLPRPKPDPDVAMFQLACEAFDRGEYEDARNYFAAASHTRFPEHVIGSGCFEEATADLISRHELRAEILALAAAPDRPAATRKK